MRGQTCGVIAAVLLACPATAGAVPDLRVTEHVVPAAATTGQLVEARVTVTNLGDTATESTTEIDWGVTNDEGFGVSEFELRTAACPPGSEDTGGARNLCVIGAPIGPGESVTAVFSGSSRFALALEARATVYDSGNNIYRADHSASSRSAHHQPDAGRRAPPSRTARTAPLPARAPCQDGLRNAPALHREKRLPAPAVRPQQRREGARTARAERAAVPAACGARDGALPDQAVDRGAGSPPACALGDSPDRALGTTSGGDSADRRLRKAPTRRPIRSTLCSASTGPSTG